MKTLKRFWNFMNGKKYISGTIVAGLGLAAYHNPFTLPVAPTIFYTGLGMMGFGAGHKAVKIPTIKKLITKRKEQQDVNIKG